MRFYFEKRRQHSRTSYRCLKLPSVIYNMYFTDEIRKLRLLLEKLNLLTKHSNHNIQSRQDITLQKILRSSLLRLCITNAFEFIKRILKTGSETNSHKRLWVSATKPWHILKCCLLLFLKCFGSSYYPSPKVWWCEGKFVSSTIHSRFRNSAWENFETTAYPFRKTMINTLYTIICMFLVFIKLTVCCNYRCRNRF